MSSRSIEAPLYGLSKTPDFLIYLILIFLFSTESFITTNGCRAAPVRQLHGDIAYIAAKPHDTGVIYIMANTSGYYVIKVSTYVNEFCH